MLSILSCAALIAAGAVSESRAQSGAHDKTPSGGFKIGKVTMAITNMKEMVRFYHETFGVELKGFEAYGGHMFYSGRFLGMNLLLCPNELAGVEAKQNRHQFDIIVADFDGVLARAAASGGTVREQEASEGARFATLVDPDGNTMVIIEEKSEKK